VPLIRLRYRYYNCAGGLRFTDWVPAKAVAPGYGAAAGAK
jgi:hypothetical protein